jgi:hypothetical protein
MDPIDRNFAALSLQMSRLAVPPPSLASLIDRVNAAKRHYEPGLRR